MQFNYLNSILIYKVILGLRINILELIKIDN